MVKCRELMIAAALVVAGLSVAPALAASNGVPFCVAPRTDREQRDALEQLARELQLNRKLNGTIDYFNGCLKVSYSEDGKWVTDFYDPNSMQQVGTLG